MTFANPSALLLLPALAVLLSLGTFYSRILQKRLATWIHPEFWRSVIPDFSSGTFIRKQWLLALAMIFLTLAAARPQWGEREEMIETRGMDVLFLLDLSNSMLAEDAAPSRLSRARNFIRKLLENLGDDRAGVVSFAGKAFLTVPLTNDFDYVTELVDTVDPSSMSSQGTRIGEAIDVAMRAFERAAEGTRRQSRAIILITDGEDFGENALNSAARIKDFGAAFYALSVGTPEGAPIPVRDEQGVLLTYKKDSEQKPILSKVNRPLLSKIADAGGGSHLELMNPDDAAYSVAKSLKNLNRDEQRKKMEIIKIDRFQIFLALSLMFFVHYLSTGYRKVRVFRFTLMVLASSIIGAPAKADTLKSFWSSREGKAQYQRKEFDRSAESYGKAQQEDPEDPVISFNQGTALAQTESKEEAAAKLQEATKKALSSGDFETAAKSLFNEGILHQRNQALNESFDRLTKSIELAKSSGLPELEEKARKALTLAFDQQQKQNQQKKQSSDDDKSGKSKDGDGKDDSQNAGKKPPGENPEGGDGRKRQFKGKTLSKDVAESLMRDLADREKQLVQRRLGNKKYKEAPNDKDW